MQDQEQKRLPKQQQQQIKVYGQMIDRQQERKHAAQAEIRQIAKDLLKLQRGE